jgi:surface protein
MFQRCKSLTTLDLSSFETPLVTDMGNIFENCNSLLSLNLKNFDTSNAESINNMFYGCSSLISLNLQNFDSSKANDPQHFFNSVKSDLIFCFDIDKVSALSSFFEGYNNNCNDICFTGDNIKLNVEKEECIEDCKNDDTNRLEYKNICYQTCPDDTHVTSDDLFLCQKKPESYYLDSDNIYKPCYQSCRLCNIGGNMNNHNCIECILNYKFINETGKENNCYLDCLYYYYFESSGEYKCTNNNECPSNYKIIEEKNKCIDNCENDDIYKVGFNNKCYQTCPENAHVTSDNM